MKAKTVRETRRALLLSRWRQLRVGGLVALSLSAARAIESEATRSQERHVARFMGVRKADRSVDTDHAESLARIELFADDTPARHALSGYILSPAERNEVGAASAFIMRREPVAKDEPLPAGFTPAPVETYTPLIVDTLSPEESAQIEAEARAEVAEIEARDARNADAVSFRSDYADHPMDYAPIALRHVNRVAVQDRAAQRDPIGEHEALRLAILGNARRARQVSPAL